MGMRAWPNAGSVTQVWHWQPPVLTFGESLTLALRFTKDVSGNLVEPLLFHRVARDHADAERRVRQFFDRVPTDDSSKSGVLSLKERRLGANRDLFLCSTERELNLHPAHLSDLNLNTIQDERLKSYRSHR